MKIKDIHHWNACKLEDRNHFLPKSSGLYAVLNRQSEVLYVGKSKNLNRRWQSGHHRYPQAVELQSPRLAFIALAEKDIHQAERAFIQKYKPAWNDTTVPPVTVPTEKVSWFDRMFSYRELAIASLGALVLGTAVGLISLPAEEALKPDTKTVNPATTLRI
jgi:excinuclease UvrABC nuclease subunit